MYTLLLVDDERLVVDTLAKTIPWSSIQIEYVHKAYSAEQALQLMNTYSIDIVITDIRMPKVTGLELIERIRELNKRTKCIVYSGFSDFEYARQAMSSQVVEYLLKPARDEEIIAAVERMCEQLDEEWQQFISVQNASATLKSNMPLLRSSFLNDLIQGKKMTEPELAQKLELLQLPYRKDDRCAILVVRLEEAFSTYNLQSLALFEFAIANIAEETMNEHFFSISAKDSYDYLVFLVKLSDLKANQLLSLGTEQTEGAQVLLDQTAMKLQENVINLLKRNISIVVSKWDAFPAKVPDIYQACVTSMRRKVGNNTGIYLTLSSKQEAAPIQSLQTLYEPPSVMQLLDMGNRDSVCNKVDSILQELNGKWKFSQEHVMEVYFHLSSAFAYGAHKNGISLEKLLKDDYDFTLPRRSFLSVKQLEEWALGLTDRLFQEMNVSTVDNKTSVVQRVKLYIHDHLAEDVTLQALADHIFLHPVYLSTLFKSETGQNLRDYIIGQKMERGAWLLKNTNDKIYHICDQIGYQNPPYFIKLFKKHYGQTPQEYREHHSSNS
jgi:two-component system response regulator YesN